MVKSLTTIVALMATVFLAPPTALATQWNPNIDGHLQWQGRHFPQAGLRPEQVDNSHSLSLNLQGYQDFFDGRSRLAFDVIARQDFNDDARDLFDVQELYWWYQTENDLEITIGNRIVFWGVTETRHLVNIINQSDQQSNIDQEDRLGQPMVSLLTVQSWGNLEAFALIGFKPQEYSQRHSRFAPPLPVEPSLTRYQASRDDDHIDWALRYSHVIDIWDIGASYFKGTNRDPRYIVQAAPKGSVSEAGTLVLAPYYSQLEQVGIDLQATTEYWLWKLEAIAGQEKYQGRNENYRALVAGGENTLYGIFNSVADLGLLFEYQYDNRSYTSADNDLAIGARLALNNAADTSALLAMTVDLDNHSQFISFEASHRLNDVWSIASEVRVLTNTSPQDLSFAIRNDDYIELTVNRYF
ncbi:hypothetical protein [Psychrobium sp. 1_MG-2023]|uniref:hypothetical protein n=1 Tax=Psychrobium sp. 1_MG-2023 TaxID=3062624 RepID=UPI000C334D63|nr:hypothetical protein [Psychrobium sp. 1_MG-2023]MDP2562437.1 hypothetical protein [Psychrobium sp. 1_MG-2023]PKF56165.1 hypothetical protein CW748_10940 [Alteromonadales bacterium alter-6D02]